MRILLTLVLAVLAAATVHAKCADRFLVFSGSVVDAAGAPMAGVMVGVAWKDDSGPAGPAMAMTDSDGRYAIPVVFPTYSGHSLWRGDECKAVLEQVSIAAYGPTHRSPPVLLDLEGRTRVTVETLHLDFPIERKPMWPDETEQ